MQRSDHNGHYHLGNSIKPASVELCGYLTKPLAPYIKTFSEVAAAQVAAAQGLVVSRGSFLACPSRGRCGSR